MWCKVFSIFLSFTSSKNTKQTKTDFYHCPQYTCRGRKTINYDHRINELKQKIKMFYTHRAIFHSGVKQKVLVNVYTRTWWKIPDIKLLELKTWTQRTSHFWINFTTQIYWDVFFLNKNSSFSNDLSFLIKTISGYMELSFQVWQLKIYLSTPIFY